ncbi:MAG: tetraacyldisaccharide 4'-kinase [Acidobacteria bacterium]|nr:tetraacyldisaccharide 4'-kinase [Acidobacteriota bacterium]MCI0625073.1 tetraacyldisaccharide 4'-kinase [Acidobacteriota bacterium]MCI0718472.1 tetraacyldisaccharide 4'-kinase [Acidobacteriota bacterium]
MNVLSPIGALYEVAVRLRCWSYSAGILRTARLQSPVVSIGNLTMGGTGKTPATIAFGKLLLDSGHRVAILSRGYKGQHRGGPLLVSDGQRILTTASEAGDEALVIARNLPRALVAVFRERAEAGAWVEKHFGVDVHLLDDGFQHLQLHRDLNLLVIDVTNPFGGGLPPMGRLREPLDAIRRADAVILSRAEPGCAYAELISQVRRYKPHIPCFLARQELVSLRRLGEEKDLPLETLGRPGSVAFAGIANPAQFFNSLREAGIEIVKSFSFPDHHNYRSHDSQRLVRECQDLNVNAMITTEKDAEKLSPAEFLPREVFAARVAFEFDDLERLSKLLSDVAGVAVR